MKKRILFIINPKAGTKKKSFIEQIIKQTIDSEKFKPYFTYSEYPGHATEIVLNSIDNYDIITAVGGDGTVNEIAKAIKETNKTLAIIPIGSGNGLARYLKIPQNIKKATNTINKAKTRNIDTITINDKFCANISGIGFDAHIGNKFQNIKKRGFINYIKLVIKEFLGYKTQTYKLKIDGKEIEKDAFLISFANSTQFGNNAYIAPKAQIDDGKIDITIINKFPKYHSLNLAIRLFAKSLLDSKYIDSYKARKIELLNTKNMLAHIDGEPIQFNGDISFQINDKSLNIICK
ncbi:MAG: YegS/Rv2252/BmrU family lipid kinase [Chlorobi bacterium]|nr:YegS/Rv2252/BmrU family lipid kinase [Chlorobiota bacterium]